MSKQEGFSLVEGLLILVIVGLVGFAGYTVWNNNQNDVEVTETTQQKTESSQYDSDDVIPDDWTTYEDATLNFSISYPQSWGDPNVNSNEFIYTVFFGENINDAALTISSYSSMKETPGGDSPWISLTHGNNKQDGIYYSNWADGKTVNFSERDNFTELSNGALVWTDDCAFVDCTDTYHKGSFNIDGNDFVGLGIYRVFTSAVDSKNNNEPVGVEEQDGDFELFIKVAKTLKAN